MNPTFKARNKVICENSHCHLLVEKVTHFLEESCTSVKESPTRTLYCHSVLTQYLSQDHVVLGYLRLGRLLCDVCPGTCNRKSSLPIFWKHVFIIHKHLSNLHNQQTCAAIYLQGSLPPRIEIISTSRALGTPLGTIGSGGIRKWHWVTNNEK